jgi:hypothetical protein
MRLPTVVAKVEGGQAGAQRVGQHERELVRSNLDHARIIDATSRAP